MSNEESLYFLSIIIEAHNDGNYFLKSDIYNVCIKVSSKIIKEIKLWLLNGYI